MISKETIDGIIGDAEARLGAVRTLYTDEYTRRREAEKLLQELLSLVNIKAPNLLDEALGGDGQLLDSILNHFSYYQNI